VVVALGLRSSVPLPGAKRPASGVLGALDFLAQAKQGWKVRGAVLVLGGGNTAMDAALSARQAGADEVAVVYRRSFAEMPAWPEERDRAIQAGIPFLTLTAPLDYVCDGAGRLAGLRVVRTRLGAPDERGRRTAEPIPGTEHTLPAQWIIEALGQRMEPALATALPGICLDARGCIMTPPGSFQTSRPGVFAAGDIVNGGSTVVQAVAEGVQAAREIHEYLAGARVV
jgi:glutamate synthase (NADPH/NADH) small chain